MQQLDNLKICLNNLILIHVNMILYLLDHLLIGQSLNYLYLG